MRARRVSNLAVCIVVVAAICVQINAGGQRHDRFQDEGRVRTESTQTCRVSPNARLEVFSINGSVDVETGDVSLIEMQIVRTAPTQQDLDHARKVIIECNGSSLQIHEESGRSESHVTTHLILKSPTTISFSAHDINGSVNAANIHGPINLNNVNGRVQIGDTFESSTISNVNGVVAITVGQLGRSGLRINNVNGNMDLHLSDSVNADLRVENLGGGLYTDLPNVTVQGSFSSRNFHAQVGAGGPALVISNVNGKVHITGT